MNSQAGKTRLGELLLVFLILTRGEEVFWVARRMCVFSGREGTTFSHLSGGFIAIAVVDGGKLMELFALLKPLLLQQVTKFRAQIPQNKDLGKLFPRWVFSLLPHFLDVFHSLPKSMNFSLLS